ncbi:MAG: hypothetical protein Tp139SUR460282_37 [Prokaryotic dsDNA virus sp.]|nr:MAG: hypothetical protein Tp139SUR460282_37 [Prokaryotic dsDNA virus sp.]
MKDATRFIRLKAITALSGNVSHGGSNVPVYNRVPSDATYPYIRIYSVSTSQIDDNQTKYNADIITRVEVVTRFSADSGGDLTMNDIMDDCLQLLISKNSSAFDLSANNFKVYSTTNESLRYLQEDLNDHTYFRAILEMSNKVAEV